MAASALADFVSPTIDYHALAPEIVLAVGLVAVLVIDLPKPLVMWRVIRRSFVRCATRQELWNGNRESFREVLALRDGQRSILRWTWDMHGRYRDRYRDAEADPSWAALPFTWLTSRREVRQFRQVVWLLSPQQ